MTKNEINKKYKRYWLLLMGLRETVKITDDVIYQDSKDDDRALILALTLFYKIESNRE